jgi:hypothetical protein
MEVFMPSSTLKALDVSALVRNCADWSRHACAGEAFYKEHEGKRYCVLHYPSEEKALDFKEALKRKLEAQDFNFRGVWFPDTIMFEEAVFEVMVDFSHATFHRDADFRGSAFHKEAHFFGTTFNAKANFNSTNFCAGANFVSAIFRAEAEFRYANFNSGARFTHATFSDHTKFAGEEWYTSGDLLDMDPESFRTEKPDFDFQFARIEKPDHISFHTLSLYPHSFVNVDARKFDFTNVTWNWRSTREEVKSSYSKNASPPYRLLAIACRRLAVNAEENHRYEEASKFRYMAMEARRLEDWRGFTFWRLSWWYWFASGYGERVLKAFVMLLCIWFIAALLYTRVGFARWESRSSSESEAATVKHDEVGAPLKWSRALTYSLEVMTLRKPEPKPATTTAQTVVMLETILGPVQAALLALAIRRKFMR